MQCWHLPCVISVELTRPQPWPHAFPQPHRPHALWGHPDFLQTPAFLAPSSPSRPSFFRQLFLAHAALPSPLSQPSGSSAMEIGPSLQTHAHCHFLLVPGNRPDGVVCCTWCLNHTCSHFLRSLTVRTSAPLRSTFPLVCKLLAGKD